MINRVYILKFRLSFVILLTALMLALAGCSTKKNTWSTRAMQSLNTRYNVYFNGYQSYEDGLKAIHKANKDDYSRVIPMYPISNHDNAKSATAQMDRTIEKCRKAIKTRSIKEKPEVNRRRSRRSRTSPGNNREEYNPFMPKVWMLLGQAEFHKADFLGAVGTFNYIARHFAYDNDLVQACRLWVIRSYAEMDWVYEAEEILRNLNQDALSEDNATLYASVYADLLLKKGMYREAIPLLELTLSKEKSKDLKQRFTFLLGQLYEHTGDKQAASNAYNKLINMSPPYEMAFNAKISQSALFLGNMAANRRELLNMAENNNNKDYLDQLYLVLGKSYLHEKDTVRALEYFHEAVDKSTRNGLDKAVALITMGDLYYLRGDYVKSQPCYDDASKIISLTHPDYPRVAQRAEILSELVVHHTDVMLQDSLQRLSAMSEAERLEVILELIANLEKEEQEAAERAALQAEQQSEAGMTMIGGPAMNQGAQGWYFYNTSLVRGGQSDFQQRWGRRRLEDNWRRSNKSAVLFAEEEATVEQLVDSLGVEQLAPEEVLAEGQEAIREDRQPEFYLKQIPVTEEQIARSNQSWAASLFKMGMVYKDKLEDYPQAIASFNDYLSRFPSYADELEALYHRYILHIRTNDVVAAETGRQHVLRKYPESDYALMLTNPNYLDTKQQMLAEQDSLYQLAYRAFNTSRFDSVQLIVDQVAQQYPLNSLMPKFMFIKALSQGKSGDREGTEQTLVALLESYPDSEVSAMTKDILALLKQGRETQEGGGLGSMLARRELLATGVAGDSLSALTFTDDPSGEHRLLLLSAVDDEALFALQFQLAVYNFSRFLLKDFDLTIARIDAGRNSLSVYPLDDREEAEWYLQSIQEDEQIRKLMEELNINALILSEYNYGLTRSGFTLDDYLIFKSETSQETPEQQTKESL